MKAFAVYGIPPNGSKSIMIDYWLEETTAIMYRAELELKYQEEFEQNRHREDWVRTNYAKPTVEEIEV